MYRVIAVLALVIVGMVNLAAETNIPKLVQFNGFTDNAGNQIQAGVQSITFALYKDQREGAPLWQETQNVTVESNGRFSVLLGAGTSGGMPTQLFAEGDP